MLSKFSGVESEKAVPSLVTQNSVCVVFTYSIMRARNYNRAVTAKECTKKA